MSVNRATILGRVGKDPEVRNLENGTTVANFSIATSESYKDKSGNKVEKVEWHNIVLWKGLADIAAKYVKKGDLIYIEGKITTRSWEKDGSKHYTTEIVGNEMKMLGGRSGSSASSPAPGDGPKDGTDGTDGLPF